MRKLRLFILFGALVTCMVILFTVTASPSSAQITVPQTVASSTSHSIQGVSAILPRANNDTALAKQGIQGARFTSADATQYVSTHQLPHTLFSTKPMVDKVAFITSQEASIHLNGETLGVPDNTLVCYVTLHGTFTTTGPSGKHVVTYKKGVEVFDAQTGNLLLVSFLAK